MSKRYIKWSMRNLLTISFCLGVSIVSPALLAQTVPPVYFNHVTIVLPPAVYTAIVQSTFLRSEFSASAEQTVQRDGGAWSYTGFYLKGQHTYLEIFKPASLPSGTTKPGQIWFNMWVDDRNRLPILRDRLAAENGETMLVETTRNAQNEASFDAVRSKDESANGAEPDLMVKTEVKAYYPDGITREKREKTFLPDRQLRDVTGFTLRVSEAERKQLVKDFRAYSYAITLDGEALIASGPEITFRLLPEKPATPRNLVIDLSMNDAKTEKTYRFGDASELRIQGGAARWTITLPSD